MPKNRPLDRRLAAAGRAATRAAVARAVTAARRSADAVVDDVSGDIDLAPPPSSRSDAGAAATPAPEAAAPCFVLTASDALAPDLVDEYARRLQAQVGDTAAVRDARRTALLMRAHQVVAGAAVPGATTAPMPAG